MAKNESFAKSGVSRAKLIAGAAAIGAAAGLVDLGCSAGTGPGPEGDDAGREDGSNGTDGSATTDAQIYDGPVAAYGGPPIEDDGSVAPLYGAAPQQ